MVDVLSVRASSSTCSQGVRAVGWFVNVRGFVNHGDARRNARQLDSMKTAPYIPALRFDWLTRLYDPIVRVTTRERRFKSLLVKQVGLAAQHRLLDVGCGTGTLAIELARSCPAAKIAGVDGDPKVLSIARRKIFAARVAVELHQGLAWDLPFPDASFERVVSSLVFHHLDRESKSRALREIRRVLTSGGELHVADWGRAHGLGMRVAFLGIQLLDGFATTADNVAGRIPQLMAEAGFHRVKETGRIRTPLGTMSLYRAQP